MKKGKKGKICKWEIDCPILTAASTPLAPRVECAVFGCRNSDRDPVSFHPLPQNPDRRSQWLKLINRQDLADKLRIGLSRAVVCSIHFPPEQITGGVLAATVVPSLCLPTKKNQFILELDGSSGLLSVPVKTESVTEDDSTSEIFQPESPPSCMTPQDTDPLSSDQTDNKLFQHTLLTASSEGNTPFQSSPILLSLSKLAQNPVIPNMYISPGILPNKTIESSQGNTPFHTAPILLSKLAGQTPLIPQTHISPGILPFKTTPQLNITKVSSRLLPQGNQFEPTKQLPVHQLEVSPICKITKKSVPFYKEVESSLVVTYADNQRNIEAQTDSGEAFRRQATYSAVENLSIPSNRLAEISNRSAECQTTPELVEFICADFKKKLDKELETAKQELHKAETPFMGKTEFMKGCDKYLDEKIANFVKSHAHLSNKFAEKKYPAEFMIFALKLFLLNPKSYRFVEGFFNLPSKESIQRFRMPVTSGYIENLMECLKVKVDHMSNLSRQCVVCFEVIPLKKNLYYDIGIDYLCGMQEIDGVVGDNLAEYAAIIAVRGLYARWKQPVSFALLSEKKRLPETKAWLYKTIESLFDIGLNVKALVASPDDEFLDFPEESYFEIKSGKIYRIMDFFELLKIARNELMQYECRIGGYLVKWEHIQDIFDADEAQELNLLPNLTEKHVRPDAASQNDVKTATELFSSNIAAAMHFYVTARLQNKDAKHTVKFLTKMKDLYNIMASRKQSKAYQTATSNKALKDILEYFDTIQLKGKYCNIVGSKFVFGLNFSINSIKALAADMKKSNVNYLLTRNLTKDFMEDYFEQNGKITPIVFTREFRKLCLANLLENTKKTATGDDIMGTIVKISEYVQTDMNKLEKENTIKISMEVNDYKISWPSNEYIAGYLLWKSLENHACEICVKNICDFYRFEESRDILIDNYKFYNSKNVNKLCRIRPPKPVVDFVNQMERKFNEYYYSVQKNNNFAWNVYCTMEKDYFGLPCEYFPIQFFKMLYIRLKIFSSIKEYHKRRITIR